jgi:hypothetical protein
MSAFTTQLFPGRFKILADDKATVVKDKPKEGEKPGEKESHVLRQNFMARMAWRSCAVLTVEC